MYVVILWCGERTVSGLLCHPERGRALMTITEVVRNRKQNMGGQITMGQPMVIKVDSQHEMASGADCLDPCVSYVVVTPVPQMQLFVTTSAPLHGSG